MPNLKKNITQCFVCRKDKTDSSKYKRIGKSTLPTNKPIVKVLAHLTKYAKAKLEVPKNARLCLSCYKDLAEYDKLYMKLFALQQQLTLRIEKSISCTLNEELSERSDFDDECENMISSSSVKVEVGTFDVKLMLEGEMTILEVDAQLKTEESNQPIGTQRKADTFNIDSMAEEGTSIQDIDVEVKTENFDHIFNTKNETNTFNLNKITVQEAFLLDTNDQKQTTDISDTDTYERTCLHCNEFFKNKKRLKYHINHDHSENIGCECGVCGAKVKDEEFLELHMNIHNGKTENECCYCSKRFTRRNNVIRHMHKHWDKKKFQCEKCGLRFSESGLLYKHRLIHEAEEQPLICSVCKKSFKTKKTYKSHMMTHREDRPRFKCHYCDKTYAERYTLTVHLRAHEGGGKEYDKRSSPAVKEAKTVYTCIICGSNFNSKDQHNQHMQKEHYVILKT